MIKQYFKKNIWWISFVFVFLNGFLLIGLYCFLKPNYTLKSLTLNDWLNFLASSGTIGAFLFLMVDKLINEKDNNHLKWQSQIPFITLSSPCDPTSNYCSINIANNPSEFIERGNIYFSICNLSKINAYDIKILFYKNATFVDGNIFNRHYIGYLSPMVLTGYGESKFSDFIYSNYNVDPLTKEISNDKFEICGCLQNCQISSTQLGEKFFFVVIEYYSSFTKSHRYKINSILKVNVICKESPPELLEMNSSSIQSIVTIKGIQLIDYNYNEVKA